MSLEILPFRKKQKNIITPQEKKFRFEEVSKKFTLTNADIWVAVINAVNRRKGRDFLSEPERTEIIKAYKATHHLGDISVGEIVRVARVADLTKDRFLSNVCFNYDFTFEARERFRKVQEELRLRLRKSISYDPVYWSIEEHVDSDFQDQIPYHISKDEGFHSGTQKAETIFRSRGRTYVAEWYEENALPWLEPDELIKPGYRFRVGLSSEDPRIVERYL